MREIKFRAWDKRNEVMWLRKPKQLTSEFFQLIEEDERGGEQFVLMQYTGLKDKNDVEICEGDILKAKHDDGRYDIGAVVYGSRGAFCLHLPHVATGIKTPLLNYMHGMMFPESDFEVIGNIYENSELLK